MTRTALIVLLSLIVFPAAAQEALPRKELPSDFSVEGLFRADPSYPYFEHSERVPFRPDAVGHDRANAWWLAEMSMLAYGSLRRGGLADRALARINLGYASIGSDASGGTQGFVAFNERFVVVSFRGTVVRDQQDVLDTMRFFLTSGPEGGVHRGFQAALDRGWERVSFLLRALPGRKVFFTGHSLGGALATLAAERWVAQGGDVQGVYTFGCPRVGDVRLRRRYPIADHYRYEHNNDFVTQIPFDTRTPILWPGAPLGYQHVGRLRLITHDGQVTSRVDGVARLRDRWAGLGSAVRAALQSDRLDLRGLDFVRDHSPRYYAVATWNALAEDPQPVRPRATFGERLRRTVSTMRTRWARRQEGIVARLRLGTAIR